MGAQNGHAAPGVPFPLLGKERTWLGQAPRSVLIWSAAKNLCGGDGALVDMPGTDPRVGSGSWKPVVLREFELQTRAPEKPFNPAGKITKSVSSEQFLKNRNFS